LPIFLIPLFLVWYWIYKRKENWEKKKLLLMFYSIFLAVVINVIIQKFVHLDRPESALNWAKEMILKHIPDASFPSDHAAVSIAFLTSLALFWFVRIFLIFLPLFIIMNLSRIIWWVHWPLDIIVWSIIWVISSFIIYKWKDFIIFEKINNFVFKVAKFFKL
jgi:undecaprenyl-diphosphatase